MILSWERIHELEVREDYPAAIDALEERLGAIPSDKEAVIRLDCPCIQAGLPVRARRGAFSLRLAWPSFSAVAGALKRR